MSKPFYKKIPISLLIVPKFLKRFKLKSPLDRLRKQLMTHGQSHAVLVRVTPNGKFEVLDGQFTVKILKELKAETVICQISGG